MQKRIPVKNTISLLFLLYAAFAVIYWKMALNQAREDVEEHSRIVAESLWNLDREGSVEYLNVVVSQLHYNQLVIREPDGTTFIEIDPGKPDRLTRILIHMKLIPLVPISADINYGKDIIGTISVVWRGGVIYPYTYVLLVLWLILVVVFLYDRVLDEKHKLESEVEKRTAELQEAMEDLRESEANFRLLAEASPVAISILMGQRYIYVNSAWEELTGYSREEAQLMNPSTVVHPDMRDEVRIMSENRLHGKQVPERYEMKFLNKAGDTIWCDFSVAMFNYDNAPAVLCVTPNITDRKEAEKEREILIQKLKKALNEIKTLRGIIPVCSHCKSIRDDRGLWNQMEEYILEHSDVQFSHSICPECKEKLYSELKAHNR